MAQNKERTAHALNGLSQIDGLRTAHRDLDVYASADLRKRRHMQNQRIGTEPRMLGPLPSPAAMLADPKVVLMAMGLSGLVLDVFVRPISLAGLALILLAATPWILQAWTLNNQRVASANMEPAAGDTLRRSTRGPNERQEMNASGQSTQAMKRERPPQSTADDIRTARPNEPGPRQIPRSEGASQVERRPLAPRRPEAKSSPPRTA